MAFFDSDIVQDEAKRLFSDYQQLMQLGSEYGKFDREGKKKFIETMEELMGRYRVFMKRFELSEDFQAKLTVEQLRTQLSQFGITPEQMFDQMNSTLERMKAQIEQPPSLPAEPRLVRSPALARCASPCRTPSRRCRIGCRGAWPTCSRPGIPVMRIRPWRPGWPRPKKKAGRCG